LPSLLPHKVEAEVVSHEDRVVERARLIAEYDPSMDQYQKLSTNLIYSQGKLDRITGSLHFFSSASQ
jgi:hypothetical protein